MAAAADDPFTEEGFTGLVASLPATTLVAQWESLVGKVGGKVFVLLSGNGGGISFKVAETTFEILSAIEGIAQAPYFARRQWVNVRPGAALPEAELRAYVAASHRLVAAGLTRKLRTELGIADLTADQSDRG